MWLNYCYPTQMDNPKVIVGALVFNPQGKMLLISQPAWNNKYCVPGGHVEWGEKLEDATAREVYEETGLKVSDMKFFNIDENILGIGRSDKKHFIFINYTCKSREEKVILSEEATEFRWVKPEEACRLPLAPNTHTFIENYLKSKSSRFR